MFEWSKKVPPFEFLSTHKRQGFNEYGQRVWADFTAPTATSNLTDEPMNLSFQSLRKVQLDDKLNNMHVILHARNLCLCQDKNYLLFLINAEVNPGDVKQQIGRTSHLVQRHDNFGPKLEAVNKKQHR